MWFVLKRAEKQVWHLEGLSTILRCCCSKWYELFNWLTIHAGNLQSDIFNNQGRIDVVSRVQITAKANYCKAYQLKSQLSKKRLSDHATSATSDRSRGLLIFMVMWQETVRLMDSPFLPAMADTLSNDFFYFRHGHLNETGWFHTLCRKLIRNPTYTQTHCCFIKKSYRVKGNFTAVSKETFFFKPDSNYRTWHYTTELLST